MTFTETTLKPQLLDLSFNQLTLFMEALAEEIHVHAAQGASDDDWSWSQMTTVVEEAGEFAKAYRRWRGFARQSGSLSEVTEELADVIIASFLMFAVLDSDAQIHIKAKLYKVITRGYVNKDADQPAR